MYVDATEKPESLCVEGVCVCESSSSSFLRAGSVMGIRFRRAFSALLWYQYSVPHENQNSWFILSISP